MVSVPGIQAYEDPDSVEPNAEIEEDDFQDIFTGDIPIQEAICKIPLQNITKCYK